MYKEMSPKDIVNELNKFIIGQEKAKKAVAIAIKNRWRRINLDSFFIKSEITPKNILMIGSTGVGKTEIARRLAKLSNSPFIKVEATKFTEVGYVGKEVDSIIRDLTDYSFKIIKNVEISNNIRKAKYLAKNRIIEILIKDKEYLKSVLKKDDLFDKNDLDLRNFLFNKFDEGLFNNKEIEIDVLVPSLGVEIMSPPGMEEITSQLHSIFKNVNNKKIKKLNVLRAYKLLIKEESSKLMNIEDMKKKCIELVEQQGIVFIDEIDKICQRSSFSNSSVSREGVQRDLLPLIEGCSVSTKYGPVRTDYILFITSGSFSSCSPSDLIPELLGRLPIVVKLKSLNIEDFEKILVKPKVSITDQYKYLLRTDGVDLNFTKNAIKLIARIAWSINESNENIGARRLHMVLEKIMEDISYNSDDYYGLSIKIDENYVKEKSTNMVTKIDFKKYIL